MKTTYKNCQSCGMPLKKDEKGGGTNADGSKSAMYCSKCYENGTFSSPDIDTAEKMQAFVKDKLKSMGFPGFIAGLFTKGIPKLERCCTLIFLTLQGSKASWPVIMHASSAWGSRL